MRKLNDLNVSNRDACDYHKEPVFDMTSTQTEFDPLELKEIAEKNSESYKTAAPFPHMSIEDFVRPEILDGVLDEMETQEALNWEHMGDRYQQKSACSQTASMGPRTRALIHALNGQEILAFLEQLTGIEGLVPDPYLAGGGLHQLRDGGFLGVHADFNYQNHIRLDRRINLLVYLNRDWKESYGGALELWDKKMVACEKSYTPDFNRCIIFNTTDTSFHGNPVPVAAPDGRVRRSIAMYYYTNGRPENEVTDEHTTLFQYRPGEASISDKGRRFTRRLLPPILADVLGKGKVR